MNSALHINGQSVPFTSEHAIRFYFNGSALQPVLYHKGKRVTQEWSLFLYASQKEQPNDSSNTADPIGDAKP